MEIEEILEGPEQKKNTMKISKTETREVELNSMEELHSFIDTMPEGLVASVKLEVWFHD